MNQTKKSTFKFDPFYVILRDTDGYLYRFPVTPLDIQEHGGFILVAHEHLLCPEDDTIGFVVSEASTGSICSTLHVKDNGFKKSVWDRPSSAMMQARDNVDKGKVAAAMPGSYERLGKHIQLLFITGIL